MYWPLGAPNVYALSKHTIPASSLLYSHDGLNGNANGRSASNAVEAGKQEDTNVPIVNGTIGRREEDVAPVDASNGLHEGEILDVKVSRGGSIFITITRSSLVIWQTKPTVALAGVVRSPQSMQSYGPNTALLLRPDALIIVVQTSLGYLITYSLATDPSAHVYHTVLPESSKHARKPSVDGYNTFRKPAATAVSGVVGGGDGIKEVNVRFRMVIRIDAGISKALALEDELVVATQRPSALQCIRWVASSGASQTSTELVSRMPWIGRKAVVLEMVYDRPMNLAAWITEDGRSFAVQRRSRTDGATDDARTLFHGFCFREVSADAAVATKISINARFSLIAVGCDNASIDVYVVKDYTGNIPLSHQVRLAVGASTTGNLTHITYSPDGYCLFAAFEHGWAMWTAYGKLCASTFGADRSQSQTNGERWLHGVRTAFWVGGGCELALLPVNDDRLWFVNMARNATIGCFAPANVSRGLMHSSDSVIAYRGHEVANATSLPSEMALWQTIQLPAHYLSHQWPIKAAVISPDGRYIAVAGRRGLAHYSVSSGRWKTFDDPQLEHEFTVRGGMCWHAHVLIAAVEASGKHELRLYSREKALDYAHVLHSEQLSAPVITISVSGTDSLLAYTYDNTLVHFIITLGNSTAKLVQVGQIGFHGIIRAPPRVRAISWILPEDQMEHGDPSQDVATASILFLVDGKLVLLQPSTNESGDLKYDMRVIAQNVEYYMLLRDHPDMVASLKSADPDPSHQALSLDGAFGHSLRDSLWFFEGKSFQAWPDVQDVLACAPAELGRDLPDPIAVPLDFSPLCAILGQGLISGVEADLVQRRDVDFSFFRHITRTQLFLPQFIRYHLSEFNSPAALHLASSYQHLPYFSHALEMLLHDVLDMEVDKPPSPPETALLPTVLSFLSSFDCYLDVIVNCTRKTELRSWQTLFSYLPPVLELFEESISSGKLNTAAGYLLVLHALEHGQFQVHEFAQLLERAAAEQDWELCRELARFLIGIDASGETMREALTEARLHDLPIHKGYDSALQNIATSKSASSQGNSGHANGDLGFNSEKPIFDT